LPKDALLAAAGLIPRLVTGPISSISGWPVKKKHRANRAMLSMILKLIANFTLVENQRFSTNGEQSE
jgi:hypothetical protein